MSPVTASTAITFVPWGTSLPDSPRPKTSAPTSTSAASAGPILTTLEEKTSAVMFDSMSAAFKNLDCKTENPASATTGAFTIIFGARKSTNPSTAVPRFGELIGLLIVTVESGAGRSTENPTSRESPGATVTKVESSARTGDA